MTVKHYREQCVSKRRGERKRNSAELANLMLQVVIQPRNSKRLQHDGIKIELIGCIGMQD